MKRIVVIAVMFLLLFVPAIVGAQVGEYGKKDNGNGTMDVYISKALVDRTEGSVPKLMIGPSWVRTSVVLRNGYYVATVKKSNSDYCFDIGGNRFIPHAALDDPNIKATDVVDNGVGGYNFRTPILQ